jgi:hypothetical protein
MSKPRNLLVPSVNRFQRACPRMLFSLQEILSPGMAAQRALGISGVFR